LPTDGQRAGQIAAKLLAAAQHVVRLDPRRRRTEPDRSQQAGDDLDRRVAEGIEDGHGGPEYDTYFLFVNATSTDATIEATFFRDDGTGFVETLTVPAQKRYTLAAARYAALSYQKFAAFFRSTNAVPFVAERTVYWGDGYFGGHGSVGGGRGRGVGRGEEGPHHPAI